MQRGPSTWIPTERIFQAKGPTRTSAKAILAGQGLFPNQQLQGKLVVRLRGPHTNSHCWKIL